MTSRRQGNSNPYQSSAADGAGTSRFGVRRYVVMACLGFGFAVLVAVPAMIIGYLRWTAGQQGGVVYEMEVNGNPVTVAEVVGWSLALSTTALISAFAFYLLAWRNQRRNRSIARLSGTQTTL